MLTGSDAPPAIRTATEASAAANGDPATRVLDGHAHLAHRTAPGARGEDHGEVVRSRTSPTSD